MKTWQPLPRPTKHETRPLPTLFGSYVEDTIQAACLVDTIDGRHWDQPYFRGKVFSYYFSLSLRLKESVYLHWVANTLKSSVGVKDGSAIAICDAVIPACLLLKQWAPLDVLPLSRTRKICPHQSIIIQQKRYTKIDRDIRISLASDL